MVGLPGRPIISCFRYMPASGWCEELDYGSFESFVRTYVEAKGDHSPVSSDAAVDYFGAPVVTGSLVPGGDYIEGRITIAEWLQA